MAPQFFEIDVWAGTRKLTDQTLRVVIDWRPESAEFTRRQLNALIAAIHENHKAIVRDLRGYALRAWSVDERGRRQGSDDRPEWTWRWLPGNEQEEQSWR